MVVVLRDRVPRRGRPAAIVATRDRTASAPSWMISQEHIAPNSVSSGLRGSGMNFISCQFQRLVFDQTLSRPAAGINYGGLSMPRRTVLAAMTAIALVGNLLGLAQADPTMFRFPT